MSYVKSVVVPGETVIAQANIHWFIYVWPACWLVLGIALTSVLPSPYSYAGEAIMVLALVSIFMTWLRAFSTELAVTTKRVIAKFGFIRRNTIELQLSKVEGLRVSQGIIGRIFNFGTVVVTGAGGSAAPIPFIAAPLQFRSAALTGVAPDGS